MCDELLVKRSPSLKRHVSLLAKTRELFSLSVWENLKGAASDVESRTLPWPVAVECRILLMFAMMRRGVTCTDFSLFNKTRQGVCGPSGKVLLTFLCELRWQIYDVVILECVPQLDLEFIRRYVSDQYEIDHIVWGPEDAGWLATRPRIFVVLTARHGKLRLRADLSVFGQIMRRKRPSTTCASAMWWAAEPNSEVVKKAWQDERRRAERVQVPCLEERETDGNLSEKAWEEALHPSKATRLQLYRCQFLESCGYELPDLEALERAELVSLVRHELKKKARAADVCEICDLDQAPNFAKLRDSLPTLVGHSSLWSLRQRRLLTGDETLLSQGLPLLEGIADWRVPMGRKLQGLSEKDKKELAGNTINLAVLMSLVAFVGRVAEPRSMSVPDSLALNVDEDVIDKEDSLGRPCKAARFEKP